MTATIDNPWFAHAKPRAGARVRLFCFPYAGGSAVIFRNWAKVLPQSVEVCPIQLPGRGARVREEPFTSMSRLVDALATASSAHLDKPFAFFGHSMGATISFELAHKLYVERGLHPVHMFVSGRRAPQIPDDEPPTFNLPDHEFVEELRRLEGTSPAILCNRELLEVLLPLLRADFELIQAYQYRARSRLECPIMAMGGLADKDVSQEQLEAWRKQSTGQFNIHMFPGNHFFLHEEEKKILQIIERQLSPPRIPVATDDQGLSPL